MQEIDLLNKEKNAIESQLVIIKMKYAEISSSFEDIKDEKEDYKRKYEEANQKVLLKEDLIKKLMMQIENEYSQTSRPIAINPNFNEKIYRSNNINDKNKMNY